MREFDAFLSRLSGSTPAHVTVEVVDDEDIPFCGSDCKGCCECDWDDFDECEHDICWGVPDIERIIFNPPATIVFWTDGTKTVVKAMEGEKYEKYAGFAMACMKKMFGSTSRAKGIMRECDEEKENETPAE